MSAATIWEASIKMGLGKLTVAGSLRLCLEEAGYLDLPITLEHAERAGTLPLHHRDPFDRMLVAQAKIEDLLLVTADPLIQRYDVRILKAV